MSSETLFMVFVAAMVIGVAMSKLGVPFVKLLYYAIWFCIGFFLPELLSN